MHKSTARHNKHLRVVKYDLHRDMEKLKTALADTREDIKGKAGQLINERFQDIKEKSLDAQETFANYVAEKPFTSVGIALLSGIFIGFLIHK